MPKIYQTVGRAHPTYTKFNLSHTQQYDCSFGQLIPVLVEEVIPGDHWNIGNEAFIRMMPMITPIMHEINFKVDYFFVPNRLVWNEETQEEYGDKGTWEKFITGGEDGSDKSQPPTLTEPIPGIPKYSLPDYMGIPTNTPIKFQTLPMRAYNLIWNEYYRDEILQEKIPLNFMYINYRNWQKDRFTVARPDTQLGTPAALPLHNAVEFLGVENIMPGASNGGLSMSFVDDPGLGSLQNYGGAGLPPSPPFKDWVNNNVLNAGFTVTELRYAFAVQKWQERNMRAGVRYTSYLMAQHGVEAQDARLQRPEYIGGTRSPIIVSEVLQTSETTGTSPQGNLAGHGIMASKNFAGKYHVQEHGYIIGIACIVPVTSYMQGLHKFFSRKTRFDFANPLFVNMSEQAVYNREIFCAGNSDDDEIFGYLGIYDEYRSRESRCVGAMRDDLKVWNLARTFSTTPSLSSGFITIMNDDTPEGLRRCFENTAENGFIVNFGNELIVTRPLPEIAEPGLIDHH